MATVENAAAPRKRIATYGKTARRRIPDYNYSSLAHRSQTPESGQSELVPSRSPSVPFAQEAKKGKSVVKRPASMTFFPPSPSAAVNIFDVPSSDDGSNPTARAAPKVAKKITQKRCPKIVKDTLLVREDAESRKKVKLSPVPVTVPKLAPNKDASNPNPPRDIVQLSKQQSLERGQITTIVARPKPAVAKEIAQQRTPRKLSPLQKDARISTPSPQPTHADEMDVDTPNRYISPRSLQMWKDLLEPIDGEGDIMVEVETDISHSRRQASPSNARIAGKTFSKPVGLSKQPQRSPRKLPRRRLIDSLVEQAIYHEEIDEVASDTDASDDTAGIEPAPIFSNHLSRGQSLAPEIPSVLPSSQSQSQSQSQSSQSNGPKFTYSKQRSMLAEEDFMKQLELDMPSRPTQPTLGKPRRGSIHSLQKLQSFQEEEEEEEGDDSAGGIRSVHELRQAGANNRFLDEIEDLLDRIGSPSPVPSSMRRSGLLDLAGRIQDKHFTRQFRSNGVDTRLFIHMGRETDLIAGFIMVSIFMTLISEVNIMPHVVSQLRIQGIARLLIRLLESQTNIILLTKDRKSNMSKVAQSLLSEHVGYLLKLPIWDVLEPEFISPRTMALKCVELMVRQTREAGNSEELISKELTTKLFSILNPSSDESCWELPSGKNAIDFYLALSALESHSIAARTLQDDAIWISNYLPIIADTLEDALTKPVDDFGVLQILILRLTLNVTNNNPQASDVFARTSLIILMGQVVVLKFKKILRFLTEEDFATAVDHLILVQGALINFSEHSSAARESLQSMQGTLDDPLDNMVQIFVDNQESTSMAESVEESQKNIAFGYLAVFLGYLCFLPAIMRRVRSKLPGKTIRPVIALIEEFISHHKTVDDLLDAEDGYSAHTGLTERLESLVSKLKAMRVEGK